MAVGKSTGADACGHRVLFAGINREINMLCPYCQEQPIKKFTCGNPVCQIRRKNQISRRWWKKNKDIYRGKHRKKGQVLVVNSNIVV